jgi:hypothetical protein
MLMGIMIPIIFLAPQYDEDISAENERALTKI